MLFSFLFLQVFVYSATHSILYELTPKRRNPILMTIQMSELR